MRMFGLILLGLVIDAMSLTQNLKALSMRGRNASITKHAQSTVRHGFEHRYFTLEKRRGMVLGTSPNSAVAPPLLFTHLLKAGGSRVGDLLQESGLFVESVNGDPISENGNFYADLDPSTEEPLEENEHVKLHDVSHQNLSGDLATIYSEDFRMGIVRSPCDYLLSMWSYQSMHLCGGEESKRGGHADAARKCAFDSDLFGKDHADNFFSEADVQRFRRWVRATAGREMHFLSLRSYMALHRESLWNQGHVVDGHMIYDVSGFDDGQYFACPANETEEGYKMQSLLSSNLLDRYECIIHTETLEADTHQCLLKYASTIRDEGVRQAFLNTLAASENKDQTITNPSTHAACQDYFDDETMAFVWEREGRFAEKVGYKSCCAPHGLNAISGGGTLAQDRELTMSEEMDNIKKGAEQEAAAKQLEADVAKLKQQEKIAWEHAIMVEKNE